MLQKTILKLTYYFNEEETKMCIKSFDGELVLTIRFKYGDKLEAEIYIEYDIYYKLTDLKVIDYTLYTDTYVLDKYKFIEEILRYVFKQYDINEIVQKRCVVKIPRSIKNLAEEFDYDEGFDY